MILPMSEEQLRELADEFQQNPLLWAQFIELEGDIEKRLAAAAAQGRRIDDPNVVLDPPKRPGMDEIALDFLSRRYSNAHELNRWSLIVEMRRRARLQLGLPV
jgi:hypothetical protein